MAASVEELQALRDPYEVLGIERDASPEAIRQAYRKLALKFHPDKNRGEDPEVAAEKFKEISTAHGILSDLEKRRRYDTGGFQAMEPSDLDVQIDLSQLGSVSTAFAAMFSKMGVPIKTAINPQLLETAYEGNFGATELQFGTPILDKQVEKQAAKYFMLKVDQRTVDDGFIIAAHSPALSKFKLLLFEATPTGQWELVAQEDSGKVKRVTVAAMLFLRNHHSAVIGPVPSPIETNGDLEAVFFKRLQGVKPRESHALRPGNLLIAVYGDNWFQTAKFSLCALSAASLSADACNDVQRIDEELVRQQDEVLRFETDFRKAQTAFAQACEQFNTHSKACDELLKQREQAYLDLYQLSEPPAQQQITRSNPVTGAAAAVNSSASKLFSSLWGAKSSKSAPTRPSADSGIE